MAKKKEQVNPLRVAFKSKKDAEEKQDLTQLGKLFRETYWKSKKKKIK